MFHFNLDRYDELMDDFDRAERMLSEEVANSESYDEDDLDLFDRSFSFLLGWEDSEPTDSELDNIDYEREYSDLDLSDIDSDLIL